jgi:hypothetical protein
MVKMIRRIGPTVGWLFLAIEGGLIAFVDRVVHENPRELEWLSILISLATASVFFVTPDVLWTSTNYFHLEDAIPDQHVWGAIFVTLGLVHAATLLPARDTRRIRTVIVGVKCFWSSFLFWVFAMSAPWSLPDVLMLVYWTVNGGALLQIRFGRSR